jgi:hypothetical protein
MPLRPVRSMRPNQLAFQKGPAMSFGLHRYRVSSVASGCDQYEVDQYLELYVQEPPPVTLELSSPAGCAGTVVVLDE